MNQKVRVLCIHFTGAFGGASRSLFEALSGMPKSEISPFFLTQRGSVEQFFEKLGPVVTSRGLTQFDNTRYSHYRGVRWVVLLRELAFVPYTINALWIAKKKFGKIDLIHVNEFTGLITLILAKLFFKAPALVHVRSVARDDPNSLRTKFASFLFRKFADHIIAIDQNVRSSLPVALPVEIIHNSFKVVTPDVSQVTPAALSNISPSAFKVGFIGNLLKVKGIFELLDAALILRDKGINVEFVIVGDDAKPSQGVKGKLIKALGLQQNSSAEVKSFLTHHSLWDKVHLCGFTPDIGRIYQYLDVLCFPSHYDAPGRPIFEAAFYAVPSIVAVRNPFNDTLIDGVTGIAIEPHNPEQISNAIEFLVANCDKRRAMGLAAKELAQRNFDVDTNSKKLLETYYELSSAHSPQK